MATVETETKDIEVHENSDIFHLMDSEDERQILVEASERLKEALVYQIPWFNKESSQWEKRDQLSYEGIMYGVLLMANNAGQALEVIPESIKVEMQNLSVDIDGIEKKIQKWMAQCLVKNLKTGAVYPGVAEADVTIRQKVKDDKGFPIKEMGGKYVYETVYDDFGRNKAVSKALRNGFKLHIPQKLILKIIEVAREKKQIKEVGKHTSYTAQCCTDLTHKHTLGEISSNKCKTSGLPIKGAS